MNDKENVVSFLRSFVLVRIALLCFGSYRLQYSAKITRCSLPCFAVHWEKSRTTEKSRNELRSWRTTKNIQSVKINHVLDERRLTFEYIIGVFYLRTQFSDLSFCARAFTRDGHFPFLSRKCTNYLFIYRYFSHQLPKNDQRVRRFSSTPYRLWMSSK